MLPPLPSPLSPRLKILHIITRLIVGGAQENTLLTCEGLHARGHQVTLLTGPSPGPEGTLMERARSGGYQVLVTPHLVRSPHLWHDFRAYQEIKKLVRQLQPDIVHTHSSKAGILGRAAAFNLVNRKSKIENRKSPIVIHTIHGLPFHPHQNPLINRAWITLERYAARRSDAIITVADAMTRQALAAGVGRPEQFTTIYSGMDVEPFLHPPTTRQQIREKYHIPEDHLVFATIARLQPLKGHDDLLAVAAEIFAKVPNAHFLWIGDGIFRDRFTQIIQKNHWQSHFTLAGLVPPEEVSQILPASDVVIHPSYREGLARALPQALLAGKPVISYDCDGAAEVCIPDQTGLLVPTGNTAALAQAILWMASNPERRATLAAAGQALCLQRFPASVMVDQIEALYNRVIARQQPVP